MERNVGGACSGGGARGDERAREKLNGAAEETGVAQVRDARARQRRKAPLVQHAVAVAGVVVLKRDGGETTIVQIGVQRLIADGLQLVEVPKQHDVHPPERHVAPVGKHAAQMLIKTRKSATSHQANFVQQNEAQVCMFASQVAVIRGAQASFARSC